jgi:photosystem II stability/assembly factor-like uncharacterized protein
MLKARRNLAFTGTIILVVMLTVASLFPIAQASEGKWRNINPTQYTTIPDVQLNSIYMSNGGTGGIGSGDGWAVGNNGIIFHWDGFSWNNQSSSTGCNLNSVNFGSPLSVPMHDFSASAGFIVGGCLPGQVALFWNGVSWFPVTTGLSLGAGNLSSVFVTSVSGSSVDAWAVGYDGATAVTYHFSGVPGGGGGWTLIPVTSGGGDPLTSVYMVSTTEGWAVGHGGKIFHWNGGASWTLFTTTVPAADFYSVFMDSSSDGWAVGNGGAIFHFTGGTWNGPVSPTTTTNTLRSVSLVSQSEGWAVGDSATILHGTSLTSCGLTCWTALNIALVPTVGGLRGVHATGGSNVWADGQSGSILLYDGSIWGSVTAPLQTNYNAVFMTGSSDGWAVGSATATGPTLVHWDGVKWSRGSSAGAFVDMYGVWEVNSGEAWAVGGGPTPGTVPYIFHLQSGSWNSVSTFGLPLVLLRSVYGTSSTNVRAVGDNGLIATLTGTSWGTESTAQTTNGISWRSVTFVGGDSNNAWTVGFNSTGPVIFHLSSTIHWSSVSVPLGVAVSVRLHSVQFLDSSHGWIAGSGGTILFWDGTKWNIVPTPSSAYNLTAIHVDSTNDGWAVGTDTGTTRPIFLHYDGTSWTTVATIPPFPSVGTLQGLFLLSSTNGFAVGTQPTGTSLGLMFHLDPPGGNQQPPPPPPPPPSTSTTASTSIVTSTQTSATSATTSQAASTSASQSSSTSIQTTSSPPTTSAVTTVVTKTVASTVSSTPATTQASSSTAITTPVALPGIPGFPWESIIAGIVVGLTALAMIKRRRHNGA